MTGFWRRSIFNSRFPLLCQLNTTTRTAPRSSFSFSCKHRIPKANGKTIAPINITNKISKGILVWTNVWEGHFYQTHLLEFVVLCPLSDLLTKSPCWLMFLSELRVSLVLSLAFMSSSEYYILSFCRFVDYLRFVFKILPLVSLLTTWPASWPIDLHESRQRALKIAIRNRLSIHIKSVVEFWTIAGGFLSLHFFIRFFQLAWYGCYFSFWMVFITWMRGFLFCSTFTIPFLYLPWRHFYFIIIIG